MKKKIIGIFICMLLITIVLPITGPVLAGDEVIISDAGEPPFDLQKDYSKTIDSSEVSTSTITNVDLDPDFEIYIERAWFSRNMISVLVEDLRENPSTDAPYHIRISLSNITTSFPRFVELGYTHMNFSKESIVHPGGWAGPAIYNAFGVLGLPFGNCEVTVKVTVGNVEKTRTGQIKFGFLKWND